MSRTRSMLWVVAFIIIALGVAMWATNKRLAQLQREQLASLLESSHFAARHSMLTWVDNQVQATRMLTQRRDLIFAVRQLVDVVEKSQDETYLRGTRGRIARELDPILRGGGTIGYEIVDTTGLRLASSNEDAIGTHNPAFSQPWFAAALARGDEAFSNPVAGELNAQSHAARGPMAVFVGVPMLDETSRPFVHLIVGKDANAYMAPRIERGLFGKTGNTYVVDGNGLIVSNTRFDDILVDLGLLDASAPSSALHLRALEPDLAKAQQSKTLVRPVQLVTTGTDGVDLDGYINVYGQRAIGVWSWMRAPSLGLVSEIEAGEAYANLRAAQRAVAALGFTAIALVMGLGLVSERARRISARHQDELHEVAMFDSLTRLPNRRAFRYFLGHSLRQANRHGRLLALLFVDLDNFKRVNDSLGHDAGDQLLVSVGERLSSCVRASDMVGREVPDADGQGTTQVARLGGDEFTVLLSDLRSPQEAAMIAHRMLDSLAALVNIGGEEVLVSPSIGIALGPQDGADVETLIKSADTAMYAAKRAGKNRYEFFHASMREEASQHLTSAGT